MSSLVGRLPRLVRPHTSLRVFARSKKGKALKRAPPPPKYRKVCRHVFPYPRCIDLFSLRPEPYCIASGGPCTRGNWMWLVLGVGLVGFGLFILTPYRITQLWYNFEDEDDECCYENDE